MNVFRDLDPTGKLAKGITVLVNDLYHLLTTKRGTMATNAEFGLGIGEDLLSGLDESELPALAGDIEGAFLEDDRVAEVTAELETIDNVVNISIRVVAATEPPTGFSFVGPLATLRAEILAQVA
jgi:hypothetical protein